MMKNPNTLTSLALCAAIAAIAAIAAAAPAAAADNDAQGFLYGTVETKSGNTYTGILRWGSEESFWDDHFNSSKTRRPVELERSAERGRDRGRRRIEIFGITIGYRANDRHWGRQLIIRFGDIRELELEGGDDVTMTLKDGSRWELDGGSNDIGADITVHDDSLGTVKLDWKKIDRIIFAAVPAGVEPPATRLYGVLTTEDGDKFEGYVQWDLQECLSTDELDGETDDGDISIEMGRIAAIEKRNRNGAWVELRDGRRLLLEDTNDVNSSIDGIFVEDARYGRVEFDWDTFERIEFDVRGSGRGYDEYKPGRKLSGTVTDIDGGSFTGRIIFDLDEAETWEFLDGEQDDVEYHIPFEMIRSIEPRRRDSSRVVLKNGIELELEEGNDVTDDNDGVVIFVAGGDEVYLEWDEVEKIEFDG